VVISNQTEGENATKSGELDGDTSALDMEQSGIEDEQSTLIEKEQMPEMEMFVSNAGEQRILDPETAKEYMGLQLQQRYYLDAIHFVRRIHEAIPILCQLLASTNKTEVIDTMDFFVTAHYYKISAAQVCMRET
jgi:condensin complex subunit 1